ncbi:alpha/beta hydrolase [Streptomyces harbinensis]|uniref:alpha/beta hydrolase n=1 Tax=Streptomyces harbinensis TaxID=1176198 RepID=UPI00367BC6A8
MTAGETGTAGEAGEEYRRLALDAPPPGPVRGAVLLLPGGRADGHSRPARFGPTVLRMLPFRSAIRSATAGHAVVTGIVRYRHRGWNGRHEDPVRDTEAALDRLAGRLGPVPVVLVGHSMGGRAALRAAGHPAVTGVVALAPWCPPQDPVPALPDVRTVIVHAERDRVTDPAASAALAARARRAGTPVCRLVLAGGDHAMLRQAGTWHRTTAAVTAGLLGTAPLPPPVAHALTEGPDSPSGLAIALPHRATPWPPRA